MNFDMGRSIKVGFVWQGCVCVVGEPFGRGLDAQTLGQSGLAKQYRRVDMR